MNILLLAKTAPAPAQGSSMFMWIGIILVFVLMYFTMFRPQKKQQQARMKMMSELKKGDRVMLMDGLYGKIDSINDEDKTVVIDADGIYLTFSRMAVRKIISTAAPAAKEETKSTETPAASEEKAQTEAPSENPAEKSTSEKSEDK